MPRGRPAAWSAFEHRTDGRPASVSPPPWEPTSAPSAQAKKPHIRRTRSRRAQQAGWTSRFACPTNLLQPLQARAKGSSKLRGNGLDWPPSGRIWRSDCVSETFQITRQRCEHRKDRVGKGDVGRADSTAERQSLLANSALQPAPLVAQRETRAESARRGIGIGQEDWPWAKR